MAIKALDHNVNIIALEKNGRRYAMCCAWATQAAEDKLICAIGPQRATRWGSPDGWAEAHRVPNRRHKTYSDTTDKLSGIAVHAGCGAILIDGSRAEAKCTVIDVLHLPGIEAENIVYLQIESGRENGGRALHISDLGM